MPHVAPRRRVTASPHILLVDDEPITGLALSRFLERRGYRVTVAADGLQALDAYRADQPDLVITDLRLPAMDGRALIRALRALDPAIPIVITTGYPGIDRRGMGAADVAVFTKPVDPDQLLQALRERVPPAG